MTSHNEISGNIGIVPQLLPPHYFPPGYPPGYSPEFIQSGYYPIYIPYFIPVACIDPTEIKQPIINQTKRKECSPSPKREALREYKERSPSPKRIISREYKERSSSPKRNTTYEPICYKHIMSICKRPTCNMIHKKKYNTQEKYKAQIYLKKIPCKYAKKNECYHGVSCVYGHNKK